MVNHSIEPVDSLNELFAKASFIKDEAVVSVEASLNSSQEMMGLVEPPIPSMIVNSIWNI